MSPQALDEKWGSLSCGCLGTETECRGMITDLLRRHSPNFRVSALLQELSGLMSRKLDKCGFFFQKTQCAKGTRPGRGAKS